MNTVRESSTARFDDAARERDAPAARRVASIDALRAIALIAMMAYHFCFDLRYFRIIAPDFEHDPFWLTARTIILSSFLLLAGVSLVLADARKASSAQFWWHVGMIAGCAMLISATTYFMFPVTFIWFGVLHAIAVSLVLARPLVHFPKTALVIGLIAIVVGVTYSNSAFNQFALGWIGFITVRPYTDDYVPLFPWTGVLLCGIPLGHALIRNRFAVLSSLATPPLWLAWLGRHTLAIYMVHQPILFGALWLIVGR